MSGHGFLLGFGSLEKVKNHWSKLYFITSSITIIVIIIINIALILLLT